VDGESMIGVGGWQVIEDDVLCNESSRMSLSPNEGWVTIYRSCEPIPASYVTLYSQKKSSIMSYSYGN
jgi:hypothetical protein